MYANIRKASIVIFIAAIVICIIVVILAIWGFFTSDVIGKTFESLLVLLVSGALIAIATLAREGKFTSAPVAQTVISQNGQPMPVRPTNELHIGKVILYIVLIICALPFVVGILSGLMRGW